MSPMAPSAGSSDPRFISAGVAQPPFFVGVDLGGTNVKLGVVDDLGRPLSQVSIATQVPQGPEDGVRRMGAAVLQAIEEARLQPAQVTTVGLGVPGILDKEAGLLLSPVNLPGWWNFPLRDRLRDACGLPVSQFNDGAAAGYAEFWVGAGRAFKSMVLFTLGTGVGGSIIVGDVSIDGEHGNGAELGHTIIDYNENSRLCACGKRGHLEAYASATAVVRRTTEALAGDGPSATPPDSTLRERVRAGTEISPLVVAEEAEKGDAVALAIVLDTARYVGIAVVNAMHTIDPSGVVIGGAMTFGGPETSLGRRFLARIKQEVTERAFPTLVGVTAVEFASLGGDAGYIGAAGLARLAARKHV
jgi:glucokinase